MRSESRVAIFNAVSLTSIYFRRQKKSSVPYPPIPDGRSIKIYISSPCVQWERLQVVDLFLFSFVAVETASNAESGNIHWIKDDQYDRWYRALDLLGSSLIIELVKILVDAEAGAIAAQKDKRISLDMATKAQEELFRPAMTRLLRTYMTFAMDSPDFSKTSLQEIVIRKNNTMRILLCPTFDAPILKSGRRETENNVLLQPHDIYEDELAPTTREQEEMERDALENDIEIEEEEADIQKDLQFQHARDVVKI